MIEEEDPLHGSSNIRVQKNTKKGTRKVTKKEESDEDYSEEKQSQILESKSKPKPKAKKVRPKSTKAPTNKIILSKLQMEQNKVLKEYCFSQISQKVGIHRVITKDSLR